MNTFPKAALFLARSFLGDSDLTGIYYQAPLLGSLLIMTFVLGIYFVMLNIFYGIMVGALEEAKEKQDRGGNEQWEKFKAKVAEAKRLLWKGLDADAKIKQNFKGLHARLQRRRRNAETRVKLMKERLEKKEKANNSAGTFTDEEGLAALDGGRRQKRKTKANGALAVMGEDSSDSEVDLGPLSDSLNRKGYTSKKSPGRKGAMEKPQKTQMVESEAIMEAVEHMASGLMERTNGMRTVVLAEMKESKMLLYGVNDVLEVLNRRIHDLQNQQQKFLEE